MFLNAPYCQSTCLGLLLVYPKRKGCANIPDVVSRDVATYHPCSSHLCQLTNGFCSIYKTLLPLLVSKTVLPIPCAGKIDGTRLSSRSTQGCAFHMAIGSLLRLRCRDERCEAIVHPLISPLAESDIADGRW